MLISSFIITSVNAYRDDPFVRPIIVEEKPKEIKDVIELKTIMHLDNDTNFALIDINGTLHQFEENETINDVKVSYRYYLFYPS